MYCKVQQEFITFLEFVFKCIKMVFVQCKKNYFILYFV